MFFLAERDTVLELHPRDFGKNIEKTILTQLRLKIEGKCTGRYGYTITISRLVNVDKGRLHEDSGFCHFPVTYLAVIFRPFKNEILPAYVTLVNQNGIFAKAGPLEIFVDNKLMPDDLKYTAPADGLPTYYSEEEDVRIKQGSPIRVKIIGIRQALKEISAVGTIKGDFLG